MKDERDCGAAQCWPGDVDL